MNKLWICFGFIALFGVLGRSEESLLDYEYYEEFGKDYENLNADESDQDTPSHDVESDTMGLKDNLDDSDEVIYDDEYEQAMIMLNNATAKIIEGEMSKENNKRDDIDDYQIEDNRSEVKEYKEDSSELVENIDDIDTKPNHINNMDVESEITDEKSNEIKDDQLINNANKMLEDSRNYEELLEQEASEDVAENIADDIDSWESPARDEEIRTESNKDSNNEFGHDKSDDLDQSQETNMDDVFDDVMKFLNGTEDEDDKFLDDELGDLDDNQKINIDHFIKETQNILQETNESFDEAINIDGKVSSTSTSIGDTEININSEENANKNLENKLNTSTENSNIDEDTVAKAYSDLKDDFNNLRETWMKLKNDATDANINENLPGVDELATKLADMAQETEEDEDEYEVIDDKDLLQLFKESPAQELNDDEMYEEENEADEIEPTLPISEVKPNSNVPATVKVDKPKLIQYVDDALNANDDLEIRHSNVESTTHIVQEHQVEPLEDTPNNVIDVFGDIELEKSSVDSEAVRITLSLETPVVLTSPNYPRPYPTNAVIDWILEGEGRGIEFNVTDFALNSIAGDYVLVKPGRVDSSGSDGILLSYSLNTPRAFRFLNVDRMFIRFESKLGLNRFRGFSFSVKMINSLPEDRVPEPEALPIGYPSSTITLNLGGVTLEGFLRVEEDFRQIIADMATMYIEANQIDPGLNTTSEVTQITGTALCFHNWPQFEQCAEVRFGVPLQYEDEEMDPRLDEEDLRDMWLTYSSQNPFALRLQNLGIKDFQIPNDNNILMVWLVIAAGVVISMAMLAFALWRFSCFEGYTRMPAFSDTESVNEKKNLDLYPTPHQTLPPLYSDTEYKWGEDKYDDTTRVDMSGFPNRSYVRTENYDFDSEEEVVVSARDSCRYTTDV